MKKKIGILIISIISVLCFSAVRAQNQIQKAGSSSVCLNESDWKKLPAHPRLFANAARWKELKQQVKTDPVSKQLFSLIYQRAEAVLALPSLGLKARGIYQHGPNRQIQGRIAALAMTYKLSGEKRFLTRARAEMTELATNTDWRPGHFLSTSEATVAMALGLDWLYNDITPQERLLYSEAIVEKGLRPSLLEQNNANWITSGGKLGSGLSRRHGTWCYHCRRTGTCTGPADRSPINQKCKLCSGQLCSGRRLFGRTWLLGLLHHLLCFASGCT